MSKVNNNLNNTERKLERGQIGIAGEHIVLAELIINGFAAGRTDGNSKDIDITCSNIQTGHSKNIQVKTLGPDTDYSNSHKQCFKFCAVYRHGSQDRCEERINAILTKRIYFIFCALANPKYPGREKPRFFIATPEEVVAKIRARINHGEKRGRIDFILYGDHYKMKKSREEYGLISDYEDKWGKLC